MAFQSLDHMIQKMSGGNSYRWDWLATTPAALTAARWYDMSSMVRSAPANAWAGSALTWTSCNESTGNGTQIFGIPHGGNVSPATKHVINVAGVSNTSGLGILQLVDIQGYWPGISTNSSALQTLSGTPALRYTNGAGCRMYFVSTTQSGATAHNLSLSYTNQSGTSGRSLGRTVSMTPSAIVNHVSHTGTAAGNIGPFLPLANGDTGVQNVASVQFSAASGAGAGALVIAKPLLTIPLTTAYSMTERDCISMLPGLPQIKDGACLSWMFYTFAATAATSPFNGYIDFGWA